MRAILVLAVLLLPATAIAKPEITHYEVHAIPFPEDGGDPVFNLILTYRKKAGRGFKFVGSEDMGEVTASTADDRPLRVNVEHNFSQKKIVFDVPKPDAEGNQTVILRFRQPLDRGGWSWSGRAVDLYWAHEFKLRVRNMTSVLHLPLGSTAPEYTCAPNEAGTLERCTRSRTAPFDIWVPQFSDNASRL